MADGPGARRRAAQHLPAGQSRAGHLPPGPSQAARPSGGGLPVRRSVVVGGLAALLVVGGLVDRAGAPSEGLSPAVPPAVLAAPVEALSSTWYCAGATAEGGAAAGTIAIANGSDRAQTATVTLVPDVGAPSTSTVSVGAHGVRDVKETVAAPAHWVAAEVDLDGGGSAVEQLVDGPDGPASTPCATSGASSWWFAGGSTLVNADDTLSLYNPYDSDAIVDLSFTTDQGQETPGDFQGIDVPARSLVAVDLRSHLRRRTSIATTVHARTGRVVATSTEVVTAPAQGEAVVGGPADPSNPTSADPASPAAGIALTLGQAALATTLVWPSGVSGGSVDERFVIYDPGPSAADVTLSVDLDQGSAEPFSLQVGPGQVTTIDANEQARIPAGVGHSAVVRSTNDVGVVATRLLSAVAPSAGSGATATAPAASTEGIAAVPGQTVAAPAWLVPATALASGDAAVVVLPVGADPLSVSVDGWTDGLESALPGLGDLTAAPGTRLVIPLAGAARDYRGPVVVRATGSVYVEADATAASGPGLVITEGVPLA